MAYRLILFDFSGTLACGTGLAPACILPEACPLLARIQAAGIGVGIVSHVSAPALKTALVNSGLHPYIDVAVGVPLEGGGGRKPDPRLYEAWIQPVFPTVARAQVLVVGDSPSDLRFARNLGGDSCWARYGAGPPQACLAEQPRYVIDALPELAAVLWTAAEAPSA